MSQIETNETDSSECRLPKAVLRDIGALKNLKAKLETALTTAEALVDRDRYGDEWNDDTDVGDATTSMDMAANDIECAISALAEVISITEQLALRPQEG